MPQLSSTDAPDRARLKPSIPGKTSSYDLSFADDDGTYGFSGPRATDDDQYVLYFDPERKAFVLDKVDSTFNMNLTRVPGSSDAEDLSRRYSHIDLGKPAEKGAPATSNGKIAPKAKPAPKPQKVSPQAKRKPTDKKPQQQAKSMALPLPKPEPAKPKKSSQFADEDDEDEDDDGGLMIEYPGGEPPTKKNDFSPAFPTQRRFDEYMDQRESEADDEDGESDGEIDMDFKLPSPVNKGEAKSSSGAAEAETANGANEDDDDDGATADLEGDLENALEIAFEDLANSQEDSRGGDESEISEED